MVFPLEPGFEVERRQAAHRRALLAVLVHPGRQGDFTAQIGGFHLQPGQLVMLRPRVVHVIGIDQIRLAGFDPGHQNADPQAAGADFAHHRAILGRGQRPLLIRFHRAHEGIRHQNAVMQVQRLAVRVAAGGAADFDEFLDLRMVQRQVDRRRAAPQAALADRQGQAVHHADERDHARGFAVQPDLFADRAQIAPVGADAAALGGEPHILVPQADNAVEAVIGFVQEAGNRQAAGGAAIGQNGGSGHEPHLGHVVVDALRVRGILAVIAGHAGEQVLIAFAGQQIAVIERGPAEIGDQRITAAVDPHLVVSLHLHDIKHGPTPPQPQPNWDIRPGNTHRGTRISGAILPNRLRTSMQNTLDVAHPCALHTRWGAGDAKPAWLARTKYELRVSGRIHQGRKTRHPRYPRHPQAGRARITLG